MAYGFKNYIGHGWLLYVAHIVNYVIQACLVIGARHQFLLGARLEMKFAYMQLIITGKFYIWLEMFESLILCLYLLSVTVKENIRISIYKINVYIIKIIV